MAIPYLNGFFVKPSYANSLGVVIFTDGINELSPNQQQCEAYGYTYDKATGTCTAFTYSARMGSNIINENNSIQGSGNSTETGTNNTYIMGERNIVRGDSRNNIIIGDSNEIASGVNNASVLGNYGIAQRPGEVVIGGGGFTGAGKGYAQSSVITLTGVTTNEDTTPLYVNGDSNVTTIARNAGAKLYTSFKSQLIGVRTGGTAAGAEGDRIFLTSTGIINLAILDESTAVVVSRGTVTGWTGNVTFSGSDMEFSVTGAGVAHLTFMKCNIKK